MTGPFRPHDLDGADEPLSVVEQAEALATARELEAAAANAANIHPSPRFSERVMTAVAAEPLPRPVTAFGWAIRRGRLGSAAAALADAWRLARTGRRPLAARAQALAAVVVLIVAVGSVSGLAVAGLAGVLQRSTVTLPTPSDVVPSVAPLKDEVSSPSPPPPDEASATPRPTESAEPTATPKRSTPRSTVHPTETPEDGDDHGGSDGSGSEDSSSGGE